MIEISLVHDINKNLLFVSMTLKSLLKIGSVGIFWPQCHERVNLMATNCATSFPNMAQSWKTLVGGTKNQYGVELFVNLAWGIYQPTEIYVINSI